ncbi:MAG: PocR ligand-binding domain-containing protein [Acidobacteriaceae bacterium]
MQPDNENDRSRFRLESGYRALVGAIAALVMATGTLVLVGWVFGIEPLVRLRPYLNPMRFNTALCLLASGGGVWLIATGDSKWRGRLARCLGILVFAIALPNLAENLFGSNFDIDQLLWRDVWSPSQPGRMVLLTAIFLVWTGAFLLLSTSKRTPLIWAAQIAAILANLTAQGAILDLIFRSNKEEAAAGHTAAAMFALSVGMLLVPNRKGVLAPMTNTSAGGRIIRSLVPIATFVPLAAGGVYLEATRTGWLTWESGSVIVVLLYSASLMLVTIWIANSIDRIDLRLAAIIDSSDDAIFSKTVDGTIVSWNPGAEKLFGYASSEVVGRSMLMLVPPERHKELEDLIPRVLLGESVKQFDTVRVCKDGTQIDVSVTISPVRNARGEVTAMSAVARNMTARKQAEDALQKSEDAYRKLAELVPQLVWKCNPDGLNIYFNQKWVDYTGLTLEESYGTGWIIPFHPEDKAAAWKAWDHAVRSGDLYRIDCRLRAADGSYRWFLIKGIPLSDDTGAIVEWFGTCTDIDDLKRADEQIIALNRGLESRVEARTQELRESEQRVRQKLESILSPVGDLEHFELSDIMDLEAVQSLADQLHKITSLPFFILNLAGDQLVASGWQRACRDFHRVHPEGCKNCMESDTQLSTGVEAGEFKLYQCKNHMWDVVTPIVLGNRHIGNLFSGQFFFDDEETDLELFRQQAKKFGFDEKEYLAAIHRVPRLSREQVMTGMAFYAKLTDLLTKLGYTGIKLGRAMTETTSVNAQLAESMKELESFAYSVSHDLRAPLRHIDGFLTLLLNKNYSTLDDSGKHYIDRTLEGSRRMGVLIDDLLQFSRIGRTEIHKTPVDLNAVIQDVLRELEPEIGKRNIDWQLTPLPTVAADKAMLLQVIENLVGNALKFTRGRELARIEIGFQPGLNGEPVFFVRDNGAGFDMRYYNKLFQVFQRLHGEQEFEGTGIGLAISRSVVERHGGRIWAEGSVGEGSTFYFSLPANRIEGELNELAEAHLVG